MNLETLLYELQYPDDIEQIVWESICRDEKQIWKIAEIAYQGKDFEFELCKHTPLTRLSVITYILLQKYDEYKSKYIPDTIIFDTFRDVSLRVSLYYKKTNTIGISKEDVIWFRHIININMFKIGVLQYQPFGMLYLDEETIGEPYMTFIKEQKEALPSGTPVINCHVQYGVDLCITSVDESLEAAKDFFARHFPDVQYKAFLCYSWLLYPPMISYLSEKSNIKQFANRFSVIGCCNDSEQAMKNLFENEEKKIHLKATTLQKMAIESRELFGMACGIIEI